MPGAVHQRGAAVAPLCSRLISAPCRISSSTTRSWPWLAAPISAVRPSLLCKLTSAPCEEEREGEEQGFDDDENDEEEP